MGVLFALFSSTSEVATAPAKAAGVVAAVTEDSDVGGRAPSKHRQRAETGKGACGSTTKEGRPYEEELAKEKEHFDLAEKRGVSQIGDLQVEMRGRQKGIF